MNSNGRVVFVFVVSCLVCVSGETLLTQSPSFLPANGNLIQNWTSSYSKFLGDIYYYLGALGNISEQCRLEMKDIQDLAMIGDVNALKIFDSSGKPSSGILEGGVYFIGFYSECVNTVVKSQDSYLRGKYCLLNLNVSTSPHQEVLPAASWQVMLKAKKPPAIGLCIPLSCTNEDIEFATNASLLDNFEDVQGKIAVCHTDPDGFVSDVPAILFLCFEIFFIFIATLATGYDYYRHWIKKRALEAAAAKSISTELLCDQKPSEETGSKMQYLLAFSFYTNAPKIFSVKARDNIACLHGLRFLSMTLIIFGHSYAFAGTLLFFRNPGMASDAPKNFVSQIFANGTFAVDTFFFMSGLLVCYAGIKTLEKAKQKCSWLAVFYVHRYVRLTPLMMAVVLNCALLLRYLSSGPNWLASIQMYDSWCRKQWWVNALYIHNFYNTEYMCLSHTWYLAADMQMYLIAPILLIFLVWNYLVGFALLGVVLFATTLVTALLTAENHYPAIPYINNAVPLNVVNEYYKAVYIKPYCRIGAFIVGMALGYFLYKKKECAVHKGLVAVGWILSVATGLAIIYLMWPANQGILPTNAEAAAYSALARSAWGACLAWLVFACYYGYGGFINNILSWSFWVPFSRLTFPAYLIHPVIMSVVYGSTEGTREFSMGFMLYMFIGHMCITYLLSLFLSLLYESPFVALEKLVLTPAAKKKPPIRDEEASVAPSENLSYRF